MVSQSLHPASALARLVSLRRIAILALLCTLLACVVWLRIPLPLPQMLPAVVVLLAANLFAQRRIRQRAPMTDAGLAGHLMVDLLALSWVLYCAGGASNPFASLLLLPLTIAATSLPARQVAGITLLGLALYTLLVFFNQPLPPPAGPLQSLDTLLAETCNIGDAHPDNAAGSGFALHIVGMWVNFVISALIIGFFLLQQARTLRQREQALQTFRERALRQEKVLAMGLMAAGAAHKMGTPLSTLAVLLGEAQHDARNTRSATFGEEELRVMREQVDRCKGILAEMVAAATPQTRPAVSATGWLAEWLDEWHVLRPTVARPHVTVCAPAGQRVPLICPDRSLDQALQGLLDNAADAVTAHPGHVSPDSQRLLIELDWNEALLTIDILDRGPGIPDDLAGVLGVHFVTTKAGKAEDSAASQTVGGLGIGFFLTNASIERFGGEVELFAREGGGTRTRVELPLPALNPQPRHT